MSDIQNQEFQNRLQKLKSNSDRKWVDPNSGFQLRDASVDRVLPSRGREILQNLAYPGSFVVATLIGMLSVFVTRYARWHMLSIDATTMDGEMLMLMDIGMSAVVGFALVQMFKLEGKEFKLAQTVGVMISVTLMHNLVWHFPHFFTALMSADYVVMVQETTDMNSLLFRGVSFMF